MKTLVWIVGAGVVCVIAMVAMKKMQKVSVEALSCKIDNGTANVAVEYANRSATAVMVDYDLVLVASGRRSVIPVKSRHVSGILVKPGEDRQDSVTLQVSKTLQRANATILDLGWQAVPAR